jgi:hypothetical protein
MPHICSRRFLVAVAIMTLSAGPVLAQQSGDDALAQNRAAAASMLERDNVANVFVDASTSSSIVLVQPDSRLVCAGAPASLRLEYTPPSPSVASVRCVTSINDSTSGIFDLDLRAIGLTRDASRILQQMGSPDIIGQATASMADIWSDEIEGSSWEGFHVEVGGGASPPHPPFSISRFQGLREGKEVYLRVAWARVGNWMFIQRVEAPLENQVAAEGLASLQFYNTLLAAQPPAAQP